MKISFASHRVPASGAVAVGVLSGGRRTSSADEIDKRTDGAVRRALRASGRFKGERKQFLDVVAPRGTRLSRVVLVGLGKEESLDALAWESIGGSLARRLAGGDTDAAVMVDAIEGAPIEESEAAARLALGAALGAYRFDRYRTTEKAGDKPSLATLSVQVPRAVQARRRFAALDSVGGAVRFARDLVSEPANVVYPRALADRARTLSELGITVEVFPRARLEKMGLRTLLAVGQGSDHEPYVVVMQWNGAARKKAPVAFVGKGVTFDSGGLSLKTSAGMESMKFDMAGSAAVIGAMRALAARKAKVDAVGVIGLVENMPSAKAQRPGDVVTSLSGQTVEVLNTDAEGRLVLADCLWYAKERFKPRALVNLATLTGAIIVSLGHHYAGLFSNDDRLAEQLTAAGAAEGERVWRLPMGAEYDRELDSTIADMKNIGGKGAGSITGAQFLRRFVGDVPWAHIDIAGTAWTQKDRPTVPRARRASACGSSTGWSPITSRAASGSVTEVSFYHLQRSGLESVLPRLLEKALERGLRAVVAVGSDERLAALDAALWTYDPASFLPHGVVGGGFESEQPVLLTVGRPENANGAAVLVLADGATTESFDDYRRVLDIFDGGDAAAVTSARDRWRSLSAAGHAVTYWRQTDAGGWERKS